MLVAGNVTVAEIKKLAEKWFEPIPAGVPYVRKLPKEPKQTEARTIEIMGNVPQNAIYKAYKMSNRLDKNYYVADLIGDMLGRGKSSRLYQKLVKEKTLFNELSAYISGSVDDGLLVIQGNLNDDVSLENANKAIETVVDEFLMENLKEQELEKVKNKAISTLLFSEVELLNRAMNLAYFAGLGNVDMVNQEENILANITIKDIKEVAEEILCPTNCSTLFYKKQIQ
jgi:zinc protease